jgi:hypothetical protein
LAVVNIGLNFIKEGNFLLIPPTAKMASQDQISLLHPA